jgi:prepilin-type N-terminal cleavage/methylation domain-containing protein
MTLRTGCQKGFTLLEIAVTIVVSGTLLAAAMPNLSTAMSASQLKSASRATAQYIRLVRASAVNKNCNSRLVVSANGKTLTTQVDRSGTWAATGQPLVLDGGTTISSILPSASALTFTSQGTASGTVTVVLETSRGDRRNLVVSPLGAVEAS